MVPPIQMDLAVHGRFAEVMTNSRSDCAAFHTRYIRSNLGVPGIVYL